MGPMWVALLEEVSICSPTSKLGIYFSYFWSHYVISVAFGNLLAYGQSLIGSEESLLIVMAVLSLLSAFYFWIFKRVSVGPREEFYKRIIDGNPLRPHNFMYDLYFMRRVVFSKDFA